VERNLFHKERKRTKKKERGGLMETDVAVEIPKTGFPQRLAKRLLAFRTVPTGPAPIKTNPQGWAKSDDQSGPNQVDKTNCSAAQGPRIASNLLERKMTMFPLQACST
jgi:hypothetical protein